MNTAHPDNSVAAKLSLFNIYNSKVLFYYGFGLFLLLCLVHLYVFYTPPSSWIAWLAVVVYLIFVILTYKKAPIFFWLFFLFLFGQGTAIISCAYLESGHYISEQATYAYATGATLRLVIYDMVFFLTGLAVFTFIKKKISVNYEDIKAILDSHKRLLYLIMTLLLLILYAGFFIYGSPLLMGLDRIDYWTNHSMPILKTLGGQVYFMTFLLGIVFSYRKDIKIIIFFAAVCVYLILGSEKFTGLYTVLYYFMLPIIINGLMEGKKQFSLRRIGIYTAVICSALLAVIYYHYSNINISSGDTVSDILVNRALGLQGHVWWGTDVEVRNRDEIIDFKQLSKELSSFLSYSSEKEDVGMKYLISLVAPPEIAKSYLERGVNFTMGYPAIGLYIFNYVGLFFLQILAACIVVLAVVYLFNKMTRFQLVRAALAMKIFVEVYASFTVGNFYQLFSIKILMYIITALALETLVYLRKRRVWSSPGNTLTHQ